MNTTTVVSKTYKFFHFFFAFLFGAGTISMAFAIRETVSFSAPESAFFSVIFILISVFSLTIALLSVKAIKKQYSGKIVIDKKNISLYKFRKFQNTIELNDIQEVFKFDWKDINGYVKNPNAVSRSPAESFIVVSTRKLSKDERRFSIELSIAGDKSIMYFHYSPQTYYPLKRIADGNGQSGTEKCQRNLKLKTDNDNTSFIFSFLIFILILSACFLGVLLIDEISQLIILSCSIFIICLACLYFIIFLIPVLSSATIENGYITKKLLFFKKRIKVDSIRCVKYAHILSCYELCDGDFKDDISEASIFNCLHRVLIHATPANTCILKLMCYDVE